MIWPWWKTVPPTPPNRPILPEYNPAHEPAPLGDQVQRGMAAERLLGDPTLAEAFAEIERTSFQMWLASKPSETARREELYHEILAVKMVRSKLIAYIGAAQIRVAQAQSA